MSLSDLIDRIYDKTFEVIMGGGQGIVLEPLSRRTSRLSHDMIHVCWPATLIPILVRFIRDGSQRSKLYNIARFMVVY